ncbi:VOC family protein [Roseomonas sp. OT10]|uniref:VOC family protein n=1 Tax=Roseomonas cutis TaxID=2897332 RepID=UPI001E5C87C6|nr:VOC family protein [Roseomonas sp. OT10]UFN48178.1 VOC family protein [Roseomonas sp. OT10]
MSERISVDFMRGIAMRAPGVAPTREFYEKNWGMRTVAQGNDGTVYFRGTGPEQWIYALREDSTYGIDYINFGMRTRERVDLLHAQLVAEGVAVSGPPAELSTPGGGYGFTALDPEGRRLRFAADVARHADTDDERALPRKVSHVVLNTPGMESLQAFFEEKLGFRISDYSANAMVFLRCATDMEFSDHHSIALNRGMYASINHVAFEMPSIDSFMRGIGRMRVLGQSPAWGPGRHGPGNNPFAYFVSPSGFVIEFTSEVQQIDEATHQPEVWPRDVPEKMDTWMTAGPPTPAMRTVMAGRPDAGWQTAG